MSTLSRPILTKLALADSLQAIPSKLGLAQCMCPRCSPATGYAQRVSNCVRVWLAAPGLLAASLLACLSPATNFMPQASAGSTGANGSAGITKQSATGGPTSSDGADPHSSSERTTGTSKQIDSGGSLTETTDEATDGGGTSEVSESTQGVESLEDATNDEGESTESTTVASTTDAATDTTTDETTTSDETTTTDDTTTDTTGIDPTYPRNCDEVAAANPGARDGLYQLYVEGDASRPWQAYCASMAIDPSAYLQLQQTGPGRNYGRYRAGGTSPGTTVTTSYTKIRIYPDSFVVNIEDARFAQTEGTLEHAGTTVTFMPYGVAMCCEQGSMATANIDLRGTEFQVDNNFCSGGAAASHVATPSSNGQVYELQGGGFCGWVSPTPPCANEPFNGSGGAFLQLKYIGPLRAHPSARG